MSAWSTLSHPVQTRTLPAEGAVVELTATEALRAEIAKDLDILSLEHLHARVVVRPAPRGGARVEGRLDAQLQQSCVVTLDPVAETVEDTFEVDFITPAESERRAADRAEGEEDLDPPDVIAGEAIDVGVLVYEHLAIGIDPYPRKPGAEFDPRAAGLDPDAGGPFAALAALRAKRN